jgi:transcriptional regulator with XRE-family HTH domain
MATLGQQLKAAREAKGISESAAGLATHILTKIIIAMEADNFSGMAAPTYAKGFIRLYAGYLGLDPEPLITEYLEQHAPGPKPFVEEKSQLEQNTRKPAKRFLLNIRPPGRLGAPGRFFFSLLKPRASGPSDIRTLAGWVAAVIVLIAIIVSISNCARRHTAEKPVAAAPARTLLDDPLPGLYLVEPGKIESSR